MKLAIHWVEDMAIDVPCWARKGKKEQSAKETNLHKEEKEEQAQEERENVHWSEGRKRSAKERKLR